MGKMDKMEKMANICVTITQMFLAGVFVGILCWCLNRDIHGLKIENKELINRSHVLFVQNEMLKSENRSLFKDKESLLHRSWDLEEYYTEK